MPLHYGRDVTKNLTSDILPIECSCDGHGKNVKTGKDVPRTGMCILRSRIEPTKNSIHAKFRGFFREEPDIEIEWDASAITLCGIPAIKDLESRKKVKNQLEILDCLNKLDLGDPNEPLYPYAVSSIERNMAMDAPFNAVEKCFKDDPRRDDARKALQLGMGCIGGFDYRYHDKPSDVRDMCNAMLKVSSLEDIGQERDDWFGKGKGAIYLFSKLFDMGTILGSQDVNTPYTAWSGD